MMPSHVKIYSDGGARGNPGPAAIAFLICTDQGDPLCEHREVIGPTTNNVAEYQAVIRALRRASELGAKTVDYYLDSQLVAQQLEGVYRVKTPHIRTLFDQVNELRLQFQSTKFTHVPRTHERIRYVDKLLNQALNAAGH